MQNKQFNKTKISKTGKDLLSLMGSKKGNTQKREVVAPAGHTEIIVHNYCKGLLRHDAFGVTDDFFVEGGNSIKAIQLASFISKEFLVNLQLTDIFLQPTIRNIVALVEVRQSEQTISGAITIAARPAQIPLSDSQERLWFIHQLEGSISYHVPAVLRLKGDLKIDSLANALKQVVSRHEVLRTIFKVQEGKAYQTIMENWNWDLPVINGAEFNEDASGLKDLIYQLIRKPFDLSTDPMLRAELILINSTESMLVVVLHHIVSDAWSLSILIQEVMELYNAFEEKRSADLLPIVLQFVDYTLWQKQQLQGTLQDKNIDYWKGKLKGIAPQQLPTDFPRPVNKGTEGNSAEMLISKQLADQLSELGHQTGTTLFMVLLAAFKVLLHRYSNQQDICVGTSIANRTRQEVAGLIGFFVNTLALRTQVSSEIDFAGLLQLVKSTTLEAYEHQDTPFEKVVEAAGCERDAGRSPLFQVMLVMPNTPDVNKLHLGNVAIALEPFSHMTSKFDITFFVAETSDGLQLTVEYSTDLYTTATIRQMVNHFEIILHSVVNNPQQPIGLLPMLTEVEAQQLLTTFNCSEVSYPTDKNIVALFEEQVAKVPGNTAVVFGNEMLSYQELNDRSSQLANYLIKQGVVAESLVPICMERSIQIIIAMIAVLKAGAAYVPIDPEYPQERIAFMLEDTGATVVLTSSTCMPQLPGFSPIYFLAIDTAWALIGKESLLVPGIKITPNQLAYVIYTSGSTGKPKGVLIEHRNVVRLFKTDSPLFDFNDSDVWSVFHSFSFDFSVWEMYGALFYGGRMVIVPGHLTKDLMQFAELLLAEKVTVLNQTPSSFYILQEVLAEKMLALSVRYVIFGGEALNPAKLASWMQLYPNCKLVNMYGITETTVHVTYQSIDPQLALGSKSIIGKPIPTLGAYILDANQQPVPISVGGELYITGAGLARGYLNQPELTAEKFLKNSFGNTPNERMYRTGDLGRWLPDGSIEYLGRLDEQVKIRGYRIELGEIETVLQKSEMVSKSVVIVHRDKEGYKRLVAYVVPKMNFTKEKALAYLKISLPEYMVPGLWVQLDNIPLTSNGKVNKSALPSPDVTLLLNNQFVAPRNEIEFSLAAIWREILVIDRVGVHDNFFELGGHSLLLMRLVASIKKTFGVTLTIRTFFEVETLEELANYIRLIQRNAQAKSGDYESIEF